MCRFDYAINEINIYKQINIYVLMFLCLHIWTWMYVCIYLCVCMYLNIHINVCRCKDVNNFITYYYYYYTSNVCVT